MPWLLLAGWIAWASLLEPEVLRRSGMPLAEPSAHLGGVLLLMAMVGDPAIRMPLAWHRWILVFCLASWVGIIQSGLLLGILLLLGRQGSDSMAGSACMFAVCWLAPAIQLAVAGAGPSRWLVVALQVSVSANLAVSMMRGSASIGDWAAAGLGASAALLTTPGPARERYANRYSW